MRGRGSLAEDATSVWPVAIQFIARLDAAARQRFRRKARAVVFMSGYHQGTPIDLRRFIAKPFDLARCSAR